MSTFKYLFNMQAQWPHLFSNIERFRKSHPYFHKNFTVLNFGIYYTSNLFIIVLY